MSKQRWLNRATAAAMLVAVGCAAAAVALKEALGSDHQDTPEVELNPRMDINDVYAFPGSTADRIVLVMTTSSPLTPAASQTATFDPNLLYQLKIDNTGDAVEDRVIQVTFEGTGPGQRVVVRGPARPAVTGPKNTILPVEAAVTGRINSALDRGGIQVFAGVRDDPFFLDLEQFFRIIPDRKPVSGGLSQLPETPTASSFRSAGSAVDYLKGFNCLAIVIELPAAQLTAGGNRKLGLWGTISR